MTVQAESYEIKCPKFCAGMKVIYDGLPATIESAEGTDIIIRLDFDSGIGFRKVKVWEVV